MPMPDQRLFAERLLDARDRPASTVRTLWASRWALLQWSFIFFVAALFCSYNFGSTYGVSVLAVGIGFFLGLFVQLRQVTRFWPVTKQVIDWGKVEELLVDDSRKEA